MIITSIIFIVVLVAYTIHLESTIVNLKLNSVTSANTTLINTARGYQIGAIVLVVLLLIFAVWAWYVVYRKYAEEREEIDSRLIYEFARNNPALAMQQLIARDR